MASASIGFSGTAAFERENLFAVDLAYGDKLSGWDAEGLMEKRPVFFSTFSVVSVSLASKFKEA